MVGAITCPVNALLRTGHGISSGFSESAKKIKVKVKKNGRVRYPRYFGPKKYLEIYDQLKSSLK